MDFTSNLGLSFLMPSQAQKHVTYNESLLTLDILAQLVLQATGANTPPEQPEDGEAYALGSQPNGAWVGQVGQIAAFQDGAWRFYQPKDGWISLVIEDGGLRVYDDGTWRGLSGTVSVSQQVDQLGVNGVADETNRLTVASSATLLTHDGDDHRLIINRNTSQDVSSLIFQTGFSGRAEIGLAGEDQLSVRTSADGGNWRSRIQIPVDDRPVTFEGGIALPFNPNNILINAGFRINQRGFGGPNLPAGTYGHDRWRAGNEGAVYTVDDGIIGLTDGALEQIVEFPSMGGMDQVFTVAVEILSGALTVIVGGQANVFQAEEGAQFVSIGLQVPEGGELLVRLEGVASFRRLALCAGRGSAGAGLRPIGQELLLCQRYFATSITNGVPAGPTVGDTYQHIAISWHPENVASTRIGLPAKMRVVPTIEFFSSIGGGDNSWYIINNGQYQTVTAQPNRVDRQSFALNAAQAGLGLGVGQGYFIGGHWLADAEFYT